MTEKTWLNTSEATEYLGLPSSRALYMRIRRGQIPFCKLGGSMRFKRAELDAVIEAGRRLTPKEILSVSKLQAV